MSRIKQAAYDTAFKAFERKASDIMLSLREVNVPQLMLVNNSDTLLEAHYASISDDVIKAAVKRNGLVETTSIPIADGFKVFEWWAPNYVSEYLEVVFTANRMRVIVK
jgi:hypothetical protein